MHDIEQIFFAPLKEHISLKPETGKALERLGIRTIRDLLFHRPRSYIKNTISPKELKHGERIVVEVTVSELEIPERKSRPTKVYTESISGPILLVFFNRIPPFIMSKLRVGAKLIVEGVVEYNDFYFQIRHPDFIFGSKKPQGTEVIYPLTYCMTSKQLQGYNASALEIIREKDKRDFDYITKTISALKSIHSPQNDQDCDMNSDSIKLLAKYEILANQINLSVIREKAEAIRGRSFCKNTSLQSDILNRLGFALTNSQVIATEEIERDQMSNSRMIRMLQGDVGSGKTLVALLTAVNVIKANAQVVLMAPTDLLARQHFEFITKALGDSVNVGLLTGKTKKAPVLKLLESGEMQILVGTHAVFQEKVVFKDLAYIIIDEQHKFGVEQRLDLIEKANSPDLLVMTATPIPRTLTLTLFGDLANSKLTDKPKGRLPIITTSAPKTRTQEIMRSLTKKLAINEKVYWICPLIEKSEEEYITDVQARYEELKAIYGDIVGLVHGKMKADDKDAAMQGFKNGVTKILVATTVLEVGIDVPDATLIVIENAEKFGLSTLHQLRGRVGRSQLQSHAILLFEHTRISNTGKKRISIMRESEDGFYIAEHDLLLRGGGEVLGVKQSGEQEFIFADLARDLELLLECNKFVSNASKEELDKLGLLAKIFSPKIAAGESLEHIPS